MEETKRRDFDVCSPSPSVRNALGLPPSSHAPSLRRTHSLALKCQRTGTRTVGSLPVLAHEAFWFFKAFENMVLK